MSVAGIATAPVSFGVYGPAEGRRTSPLDLLDGVVAAGYDAMELGPPGFFGTPAETAEAFAERGLRGVGAYVPIRLSADDAVVAGDLSDMRQTLAELVSVGAPVGVAILAAAGTPELLRHPARSWDDHRLALDDAGWSRTFRNVDRAIEMAEQTGVRTSFHPHIGTYIESPWEVERLLEATPVRVTLDTGHCWLAGADPSEFLVRFGDRVNHVHLKDVRRAVLERARATGRTDFDAWWAGVSSPLGAGDLDLEAFLRSLLGRGYRGWLVIEQDRLPLGDDAIAPVVDEQAQNRRWVEAVLRRSGTARNARETGVTR